MQRELPEKLPALLLQGSFGRRQAHEGVHGHSGGNDEFWLSGVCFVYTAELVLFRVGVNKAHEDLRVLLRHVSSSSRMCWIFKEHIL